MNEQLLAKIDVATQAMWTSKPADVARMVGRNFDTGKEFSVWAYSWGYLSKALAARQCRRYADSFEHSAHMSDTYTLLREAAEGFERVEDHAGFAKLARTLQRFLMQMSFWIDIELPWAEVCSFIDKRWHDEAAAQDARE